MKNRLLNLFQSNAKRGAFKAEGNVIELYDVIVSSDAEASWYGGVSLQAFSNALGRMNGTVHLRINSPGGDVFAGIAMAQIIREYKGDVIAHVDGYAASAASLLPLACSKTIMAPQSMIMVHCAWTIAMGNSEDFLEIAALLSKIDGQLSEAYAAKGKQSAAEFLALMKAETWLTPQESIAAGLATEVAPEKSDTASAKAKWDLSVFDRAPAPPTPTQTESEKAEAIAAAAAVTAAAQAAADESERQQRIRVLQSKLVMAA